MQQTALENTSSAIAPVVLQLLIKLAGKEGKVNRIYFQPPNLWKLKNREEEIMERVDFSALLDQLNILQAGPLTVEKRDAACNVFIYVQKLREHNSIGDFDTDVAMEFVHPFPDDNGLLGKVLQTISLAQEYLVVAFHTRTIKPVKREEYPQAELTEHILETAEIALREIIHPAAVEPAVRWLFEKQKVLPEHKELSEQIWIKKLGEARDYFQQHKKLPPEKDNRPLYSWIHYQRNKWEKNKLSPDRITALKSTGINFHQRKFFKADWEQRFDELALFIKQNNRLPSSLSPAEEISLYGWYNKQRNRLLKKKGTIPLSAAQIKQLKSIGLAYKK